MTIRKEKDVFKVMSEMGKTLSGNFHSKEQARKKLAQVELFKHHSKSSKRGLA